MFKKPTARRDPDACPPPAVLESYAAQRLAGRRNEAVFQHLKYCSGCLRALAQLTRVPSPSELTPKPEPWWRRLFRRGA
jgi:hypothetical protein